MDLAWLRVLALALLPLGVACKGGGSGQESGNEAGTASSSTGAEGQAPSTPALLSPANEAVDVPVPTQLCWAPSEDPDGDAVRYRVFVDGVELSTGKLGPDGFEDTCTTPLNVEFENDYAWSVQAFEAENPASSSEMSQTWSFRTGWDGDTKILFEDEFETDKGWTVSGDATDGAWMRGDPIRADYQDAMKPVELAQPDSCNGGENCLFTGQNPDGVAENGDIDGGTTIIVSPAFDMSGVQSVTISLARFFFRSDFDDSGNVLQLELLVPDANEPDGFQAFVLERIDNGPEAMQQNLWTPVAFAACGVPYVSGARLRIRASDLTTLGVVEAAIDSVTVTGHDVTDNCEEGEGTLCDPNVAQSCGVDLLCCPQGSLNTGVYRCSVPAVGLDPDDPPANPNDPPNGASGCDAPDLTVHGNAGSIYVEDIFVEDNACSLYEGCVDASGWRRVLRFDALSRNIGSSDLVLGLPSDHPDLYHFSDCHMHYHFDNFARYELVDDGGDVVATGHKQAFCLLDWRSWAWPWLEGNEVNGDDGVYHCFNQGLGRGWEDEYAADLDCQWVDITDVPPGDYTIHVEINVPTAESAVPLLVERDYTNNTVDIPVTVP